MFRITTDRPVFNSRSIRSKSRISNLNNNQKKGSDSTIQTYPAKEEKEKISGKLREKNTSRDCKLIYSECMMQSVSDPANSNAKIRSQSPRQGRSSFFSTQREGPP